MKDTYPGFVWRSQEKTRLELEPQMESFVVEPQKCEGMSIKGPNTVRYFLNRTYYTYLMVFLFRYAKLTLMTQIIVMTLTFTLHEFSLRQMRDSSLVAQWASAISELDAHLNSIDHLEFNWQQAVMIRVSIFMVQPDTWPYMHTVSNYRFSITISLTQTAIWKSASCGS